MPRWGWMMNKRLEKVISTRLPYNKDRIYYGSMEGYFFLICANPFYYEKLYNYGLVSRTTVLDAYEKANDKASKRFTKHQRLSSLLRVGFEVAGNLLNKHWSPKAHIRQVVDHFVDTYFRGHYVIGFQIRTHFVDTSRDLDVFLACADEIETRIRQAAETPNQQAGGSAISVRWFIACDWQQVIDMYAARFPNKLIVINETLADSMTRAIVDVELLSRCDELIVTGGSTFGFVAAIKTLRLPLFVNGRVNMTSCKRTDLSRPPSRLGDASFK